jgi:hypothetical protein
MKEQEEKKTEEEGSDGRGEKGIGKGEKEGRTWNGRI